MMSMILSYGKVNLAEYIASSVWIYCDARGIKLQMFVVVETVYWRAIQRKVEFYGYFPIIRIDFIYF